MKTATQSRINDDEIRWIMLRFFCERNRHARSIRGRKSGASLRVSDIRRLLKASHGLTQQEVHRNLTYLVSQVWVEERPLQKAFTTPKGSLVPAVTMYYSITAAGIDKVDGCGEFTREGSSQITIDATGQNVITLGDGNRVHLAFGEVGEALSNLRESLLSSPRIDAETRQDIAADLQSIQVQLTKTTPNRNALQTLWSGVQVVATAAGFSDAVSRIARLLSGLLP